MTSQKIFAKSLSLHLPPEIDLFICAASFEARSRVISQNLASSKVHQVMIVADDAPGTSENFHWLFNHFSTKAMEVKVRINDPLFTADSIRESLQARQPVQNPVVLIDITTFTHEMVLILLKVLQSFTGPHDRVIGVYNSAAEYSVGSAADEKWLTKGVTEVRSVLGFAGHSIPTNRMHLIVLAGFETERAEKLIDNYEPSLLSIGLGDPLASIAENHYSINQRFHRKLVEKYRGVEVFTFSCSDPMVTKAEVEKRVSLHPYYNVVVAPLNTKISTIGVALAALKNESIQVCYATVQQYNYQAYSTPSENCFMFDIPLL